jgi:hypothetical protein
VTKTPFYAPLFLRVGTSGRAVLNQRLLGWLSLLVLVVSQDRASGRSPQSTFEDLGSYRLTPSAQNAVVPRRYDRCCDASVGAD